MILLSFSLLKPIILQSIKFSTTVGSENYPKISFREFTNDRKKAYFAWRKQYFLFIQVWIVSHIPKFEDLPMEMPHLIMGMPRLHSEMRHLHREIFKFRDMWHYSDFWAETIHTYIFPIFLWKILYFRKTQSYKDFYFFLNS